MSKCPICGFSREGPACSARILNRYDVGYLHCPRCGLLQTEYPYWLDEAYNSPIADTDTGLVSRNIAISKRLSCILFHLFDRQGRYGDIAGGYGLLTRLMRGVGFDFFWSDPHCQNLFAKGFEMSDGPAPYTAITAFEVLEHVYDPIEFLEQSLKKHNASTVIFSTDLYAGDPPLPGNWSYYSPETGQHISFYQTRTIHAMGERLSLYSYSCGRMHMLTDRRINRSVFAFLAGRWSNVLSEYVRLRMTSRNFADRDRLRDGINPH